MINVDFNILLIEDNQETGWGIIFFKIEENYYPSLNWKDQIYGVLNNWMYNINDSLNKNKNEIILNFLDTDFALKLTKLGNKNHYTISEGYWDLFNEEFSDRNTFSETIDFEKLLREIIQVCQNLICFTRENNINYPEIHYFIRNFSKFNKTINPILK